MVGLSVMESNEYFSLGDLLLFSLVLDEITLRNASLQSLYQDQLCPQWAPDQAHNRLIGLDLSPAWVGATKSDYLHLLWCPFSYHYHLNQ